MMSAATIEIKTNFIDKSRSVRGSASATALPLPPSSFLAKPTAPLMTPHDLMIPMIPAIAIAPTPIERP